MRRFRVVFDEPVWERASVVVEADDQDDAVKRVLEGEFAPNDIEWMRNREAVPTLDPNVVSVEEAKED